uniref:Uncharacterized protein n=1 Tax=Pararge aegeria TaxID=116150 RepID=S4PRR2_9NEOP
MALLLFRIDVRSNLHQYCPVLNYIDSFSSLTGRTPISSSPGYHLGDLSLKLVKIANILNDDFFKSGLKVT